jgi:hypothetical protein
MARTRQEANTIQEGANRYAEQVLGELEVRLKELSQVVLAGRQELGRIQVQEPSAPRNDAGVVQELEPMGGRARRAAGRLRRAASRNLAS